MPTRNRSDKEPKPSGEPLPSPGTPFRNPPEMDVAPETRFTEEDLAAEVIDGAPEEPTAEVLEAMLHGDDSGLGAGFEVPAEEFDTVVGEPEMPPVVPPESAARGMLPLFDDPEVFEPPSPEEKARPEAAPPSIILDREADKLLIDFFIKPKMLQGLWERADQMALEINEKIENLNTARELLNQLQSAKNLLLETRANYEEAERRVNEVSYQIDYYIRTKRWSSRDGYIMFGYEILWALFFVFLLIYFPVNTPFVNLDIAGNMGGVVTLQDLVISINSMLWGGLGGVFGALLALWRYVGEGKYNPMYRIWYYSQPITGMVIGLFVFLFIKVGFNVTAGDISIDVGNPYIVYILAWVGGFQNKVVLNMVRSILKLFKIEDPEEKAEKQQAGVG